MKIFDIDSGLKRPYFGTTITAHENYNFILVSIEIEINDFYGYFTWNNFKNMWIFHEDKRDRKVKALCFK